MASIALILSLLASFVALLGPVSANLGLVAPLTGFYLFVLGALPGGLLTIVLGLIGLYLARGGDDPTARTRSLGALAIGLGLVIVVLGAASTAGDAPPINDITTDLEDPPAFASPLVVPEYKARNMNYPEEFVEVVRTSYPDLAPLRIDAPPDEIYERAITIAESFGWTIVARSDDDRVFDAQDESSLFRFVDDITVRIVPDGEGSKVDMRSKSRDGQSDLGANAARIRTFFDALG